MIICVLHEQAKSPQSKKELLEGFFMGCHAQVKKGAIVGAGAMLSPGKTVPSGEIWAGNPARFLRNLEEGEADFIIQSANNYSQLAAVHSAENGKTFEEIEVTASICWHAVRMAHASDLSQGRPYIEQTAIQATCSTGQVG